MIDMRPILLANGILLLLLSLVMLFPALLDLLIGSDDWKVFATSSFITGFTGGMLYLTNNGYKGELTIRGAFIFTTSAYLFVSAFAAIPFFLSDLNLSVVNSYFESISGLTTTGATVITNLDAMPPGILLWRSLLNAMGGIGIVVLALAILPMLQIGGMQLFRTESSETLDKMLPRTTQIALVITLVFITLMLACSICYWMAGMNGFDALNHAMATVATAGFSTHDESIAYYNIPAIEWVSIVFMISGALPIILYFQVLRGNPMALFGNSQVRFFLGVIAAVTTVLTTWLLLTHDMEAATALRHTLFSVVAVITTTGFAAADYAHWGPFATSIFFMLIVVGGCTGSASGGIKIFRFQILFQAAKTQINKLIHPHGVFVPRYNNKPITDEVSSSVMSFIIFFGLSFTLLAVVLSLYGLDFITSMSAAAQALSNVGPGLGEVIGPTGNYTSFPDGAKWMLASAMIMGRLELFTVLVLFSPTFWRD